MAATQNQSENSGNADAVLEPADLDDLDLDFPDLNDLETETETDGTTGMAEPSASEPLNAIVPTDAAAAGVDWDDDDSMEPVALSEEELESILGDTDEVSGMTDILENDIPEVQDPAPDELAYDNEGMPELDDEFLGADLQDIDGGFVEDGLPELGVDDLQSVNEADVQAPPPTAGLSDAELADELDIKMDGDELEPSLGEAPVSDELPDDFFTGNTEEPDVTAEPVSSSLLSEDDEGPITLSEDELSGILDDVTEEIEGGGETPLYDEIIGDESISDESIAPDEAPMPSVLDELDDEGPITLTAEELGNIVSDVEEDSETASSEIPEDTESLPSILDDTEDEGPVALSEDELDSILEDVADLEELSGDDPAPPYTGDETTGEESLALAEEDGPGPVIDLDSLEDAAPIAAAAAVAERESDGIIDEASTEGGVAREDLRKVISYLDKLFDQLPDETVREFSRSEYFELYRKLMSDLEL